MIWYILLIVLALEIAAYGLSCLVSERYHKTVLERFNAGASEWREADKNLPYSDIINSSARQSGLSGQLVAAVIQAESSFQPQALSRNGAYGLMQIIPDTWRYVNREINVCNGRHAGECTTECFYNPELNIRIGTAYLAKLVKRYNGDIARALAAYNAGPGVVDKYAGIPPYGETQEYLERIIGYWYKNEKLGLSVYSLAAERWGKIGKVLGWWVILTVLLETWVGWLLFRRHRSWRWR